MTPFYWGASPGIFDWICNFRGRWAPAGSRQAALGLIDEVDNVHKLAEQPQKLITVTPPHPPNASHGQEKVTMENVSSSDMIQSRLGRS